jgi:hypothetical protein
MKTSNYFSGRSVLSLMAALVLIPVTALSQNTPVSGQPASLVYSYPLNKQVKYKVTTKILQVMDINGQSMENNINNYTGMTLKSLGASGSNFKIEVKIDTMAQNVDSPGGSSGGPIPAVAGKTYNIIIPKQRMLHMMPVVQQVMPYNLLMAFSLFCLCRQLNQDIPGHQAIQQTHEALQWLCLEQCSRKIPLSATNLLME